MSCSFFLFASSAFIQSSKATRSCACSVGVGRTTLTGSVFGSCSLMGSGLCSGSRWTKARFSSLSNCPKIGKPCCVSVFRVICARCWVSNRLLVLSQYRPRSKQRAITRCSCALMSLYDFSILLCVLLVIISEPFRLLGNRARGRRGGLGRYRPLPWGRT